MYTSEKNRHKKRCVDLCVKATYHILSKLIRSLTLPVIKIVYIYIYICIYICVCHVCILSLYIDIIVIFGLWEYKFVFFTVLTVSISESSWLNKALYTIYYKIVKDKSFSPY
jgi:hypothetical protein